MILLHKCQIFVGPTSRNNTVESKWPSLKEMIMTACEEGIDRKKV